MQIVQLSALNHRAQQQGRALVSVLTEHLEELSTSQSDLEEVETALTRTTTPAKVLCSCSCL